MLGVLDTCYVAILNRRGITDSPSNYTNLFAWWKADSLTLNDGDAVGGTGNEWHDSSGNTNNLTQATSANRPTFKRSIVNGYPVVRFDGVNDILNCGTQWQYSGQAGITIMSVSASTGASYLMGHSSGTQWEQFGQGGLNKYSFNWSVTQPASSTLATARGNFLLMINKVTYGSPSAGTFTENDTSKGGYNVTGVNPVVNQIGGASASNLFTGDIAEVLLFDQNVSDANCLALYNNYFKPKYSLP